MFYMAFSRNETAPKLLDRFSRNKRHNDRSSSLYLKQGLRRASASR
jgi:hypothetical protein